jgi:hypothetical protein
LRWRRTRWYATLNAWQLRVWLRIVVNGQRALVLVQPITGADAALLFSEELCWTL